MARTVNRLSARFVEHVKEPGLHADGAGLYLNTTNDGRRWVFIFRWNGKRQEMGLGSAQDVSLARAREFASRARDHLKEHVNPIAARQAERLAAVAVSPQAVTFGQFADDYISSVETGWKNPKHRQQWKNSLRDHAKHIRDIPISDIGTEDVLAVLQPIWLTKSETASRVRGRMEKILDAAKARGLRSRDSMNPAALRGHLDILLPKRPRLARGHHAAMPYAEVPTFVQQLRVRSSLAAIALELLILGANRTGEIINARKREFDLQAKLWNIPADRMKAGIPHTVPLTDPMIRALKNLGIEEMKDSDFIFAGRKEGRPLSSMAMDMQLRRMKLGHYTVHGFRSAFKDWSANETDFPDEISEECLAHIVGSRVRRAYRRGEALERRQRLMQAWATYCESGSRAQTNEAA